MKFFSDQAVLEGVGSSGSRGKILEFSLVRLSEFSDNKILGVRIEVPAVARSEELKLAVQQGFGEQWKALFDTKAGADYDSDPSHLGFEQKFWVGSVVFSGPPPHAGMKSTGTITMRDFKGGQILLSGLNKEITQSFGAHVGPIYIRFIWRLEEGSRSMEKDP